MSTLKRSLNVGVVGMGNMGIPIVRNLGFKARSAFYLQIHSRSLAKARKVCDDLSVDGVTCAMRLHDRYDTITKWCDVIVLALANEAASRSVLLEHNEALLPHAKVGQVIVDHTTVDVELSRECAAVALERGACFLDAPMSGSPAAAFNGQLVLMVGGDGEYFQRMQPIFRMYADTIHHMGDSGSGSATKLLSQALVASHNAAAAEAMTIANRLGIEDQSKLIQVLDASWGSSTMLRRNAPTMQQLIRNPDKTPPVSTTSVNSLLSDLELLDSSLLESRRQALARTYGTPSSRYSHYCKGRHNSKLSAPSSLMESEMEEQELYEEEFPVLDASLRMLGSASEAGLGDRDMSAVIHYIQAAALLEKEERASKLNKLAKSQIADNNSLKDEKNAADLCHTSDTVSNINNDNKVKERYKNINSEQTPLDAKEPTNFTFEDFY